MADAPAIIKMIANEQLVDPHSLDEYNDQTVIYEVVRIIDQKILFLDDHWERFCNSHQKMLIPIDFTREKVISRISRLVAYHHGMDGNIRFQFVYRNNGQAPEFFASYIPHAYPDQTQYANGVNLVTLQAMRSNPNAKVQQPSLKLSVARRLSETGAYEVVLVHPDGYITEGSRSNLFMIKGQTVYTAPTDDILPGITHQHILDIGKMLNIEILQQRISLSDFFTMDAVFLTGTSPKVLPVRQVDDHQFMIRNVVADTLKSSYEEEIASYLKNTHKITD